MKKILFFVALLHFISCNSQNIKVINYPDSDELNYFFARIEPQKTITKDLFNRSVFVKIFEFSDSKKTPESFSEGTEEFLTSYIISLVPDGDYYTKSKLYKIEALEIPKILEVTESKYPKISIKIEYGPLKKRKTETFFLEGVE